MAIRNLNDWLDKHSRELDSFGEYEVMEATDQATSDRDMKEWKKENAEELKSGEKTEDDFWEERTGDDYYPIWNTFWEFPTSYSAEELNSKDIRGLVFFEVDGVTWAGLTTCGMSMNPSIEYAYFMYSDLDLSKKYFVEKALRQPDYFKYVVGTELFKKFCERLGITERRCRMARKRVERKLKEFDATLDNISKLRDEGKINQTEAGLLGIMTYLKSEK